MRPDWIIETGTGNGGRALFLASICDLLGHGQVLSIDDDPADDLPEHPRITYLRQPADQRAHAAEARRSSASQALVILGAADADEMMTAFETSPARAGRLLRGGRGHHPQRAPGVAGLRWGPMGGGTKSELREGDFAADPSL